jgi:hypothetical protein
MPDAAAEYNRILAADPAAAREQWGWLLEEFHREGIQFDGRPMRTFLRPHFVDRGLWTSFRDDAKRLLRLAVRTARFAFDGDASRLSAFLGIPDDRARWIRLDPGEPDVVLSRLDGFASPGRARFVEINSDAPAGFGYGDRMAAVFRRLPAFRSFSARRPVTYEASASKVVEAIVGAFRARGGVGVPSVAIVDFAQVRTRADQEILQQFFRAAGVPCLLEDPRSVELRSGRLSARGVPVDVVYRRTVLQELLEKQGEVSDFLEGYRRGAALFVNSLRCQLSEDKGFFAILSDEAFQGMLADEERALVSRLVPWTRKLEDRATRRGGRRIDLVPHVLDNREDLVLKPAHGYGGQSVLIGDETEAPRWEEAVLGAVGGPWVVQERVDIPLEPFPVFEGGALDFEPLNVSLAPFYVDGADVGAVARVSRARVVNVSAGGGSVPTFIVG